MRRGAALLGILGVIGFQAAVVLAASRRVTTKPVIVAVRIRDTGFALSPASTPPGKVEFVIRNSGKLSHDFRINHKATPVIAPGKRASLVVTLEKPGAYAYASTLPGQASKGLRGTFKITALPLPAAATTATQPSTTQTADAGPATTTVESALGQTGPFITVRSWGTVQVAISFDRTTVTTATSKTPTLHITNCSAAGPDHTSRSAFITAQAIPLLCQEVLAAQSASIHLISGATDTSAGFVQSLQAAILQAIS